MVRHGVNVIMIINYYIIIYLIIKYYFKGFDLNINTYSKYILFVYLLYIYFILW
jgi:hypothetical protein